MRPNGPAIRAIREAQKMGIRALERTTGLDRSTLSRIERGLIQDSAEPSVRAIAAALHVQVDAITREEKT
ncbi:hypothetical protein AVW11_03780 [Streptomyces amritsarensis]|uniref:HTH cro/C1-type domain-containing protein n=1 Tax=Streptomyces amritsarensis TaxID=681158 RepID=A0ABX3GC79_9ACTN|nr:helix-turn-helix transcriptional regulator [Streptomyces amritsarensis]OLZ72522.1 hypothetical protein AVW11_03780 [Streptomyces amritsarensis]